MMNLLENGTYSIKHGHPDLGQRPAPGIGQGQPRFLLSTTMKPPTRHVVCLVLHPSARRGPVREGPIASQHPPAARTDGECRPCTPES